MSPHLRPSLASASGVAHPSTTEATPPTHGMRGSSSGSGLAKPLLLLLQTAASCFAGTAAVTLLLLLLLLDDAAACLRLRASTMVTAISMMPVLQQNSNNRVYTYSKRSGPSTTSRQLRSRQQHALPLLLASTSSTAA